MVNCANSSFQLDANEHFLHCCVPEFGLLFLFVLVGRVLRRLDDHSSLSAAYVRVAGENRPVNGLEPTMNGLGTRTLVRSSCLVDWAGR